MHAEYLLSLSLYMEIKRRSGSTSKPYASVPRSATGRTKCSRGLTPTCADLGEDPQFAGDESLSVSVFYLLFFDSDSDADSDSEQDRLLC